MSGEQVSTCGPGDKYDVASFGGMRRAENAADVFGGRSVYIAAAEFGAR
jgi:hypothetical protein